MITGVAVVALSGALSVKFSYVGQLEKVIENPPLSAKRHLNTILPLIQ